MAVARILVIEDETMLRQEILEWLTFEGYEVLGAADGTEGLESAFRSPPDLIICDITMPRLDGYGVLLELHSKPATAGIPFVFVTARAGHEDIRKGMNLGADDYISKPFTRLELLQGIRTRLEKKASLEQENQGRLDQLQQALTQEHEQRLLKSKLVAMFSHDFRNQLTVIVSSASLVRDYADRMTEQRRAERMNAIEGSARLLLDMLDDMLTVAQMETGNLTLKLEPLSVGQYIHDIVEEFQAVSGGTHALQFKTDFSDTVPADTRLLRQIASNLISNALKYSPTGSRVHVALEGRDGRYILIVKDQGVGISEKDQLRLFNPFQRGSNVGSVSGTGLGLAIVKQAVDLLGGSISLESTVGVGTTVTVSLPSDRPVA